MMPRKYPVSLPACAAAGFFFLLSGCGSPPRAEDASFNGTWKFTEENGITKQISEFTVAVAADKNRFRTVKTTDVSGPWGVFKDDLITVFDGDLLYSKNKRTHLQNPDGTPADGGTGQIDAPQEVPGSIDVPPSGIKPEAFMLKPLRFWARTFPDLKKSDGEQVAGRETVLYSGKQNRPDGTISISAWADKNTGVILKYRLEVYSSQVDSLVQRNTEECQQIEYGPVDPSAFSKS